MAETIWRLRSTFVAIAEGVRGHAMLYIIACATYTFAGVESMLLGRPVTLGLVGLVTGTTFIFLFLFIGIWLFVELVRLIITKYQGSAILALKAKLFDDILAPSRVSNTIHAFLANGIFFVGFLAFKKNIPVLYPFAWDEAFMQWDKVLHFGMHPYELLAPLLQYPLATFVINVTYNVWFLVLLTCFFWQGFTKFDNPLRQRFLTSYLMTWFLGTCISGTILSSAGPCFYGFVVGGDNPYAPLMDYLRQANALYPIWAVPTQDLLWQSHLAGFGEVEGVSAMPSMHVATTILFFLLAFAAGKRRLGWALVAFAVSIFVGSVALAWHYAVDGYIGAAIALFCWWLAGKIPFNSRPSSAPI